MPGDMRYAHEKFATAAHSMATGEGTLADRLLNAYRSQASRADPDQTGVGPPMSDGLADRIRNLRTTLTAVEDRSRGSIEATITQLDDDEIKNAAEELWSIFRELEAEWHDRHG